MKITTVLILAASLQLAARTDAQNVTISVKNASVQTVFAEIAKQTGMNFMADNELLAKAGKVTLDVKNMPVNDVLKLCFVNSSLDFDITGQTIVIKQKASPGPSEGGANLPPPPIEVKGRVTDENGEGVVVTVQVKGTQNATTTDADGYYSLKNVDENAILVLSGVSIETSEVKVNRRSNVNVVVKIKVRTGDETIVVAYNTTTTNKNVSSLTVVKGDQIQDLPNRSFDKSLQGLVPGLLVTQGTGQPGGGLGTFVLRGIATGGDASGASTVRNPLVVIDGIPVYQDPAQAKSTPVAYTNPMAQLNPSDIETITVLKDAAAIALYGSKASNGVILVTTKKGKAGKTIYRFRHQTDIARRMNGEAGLLSQEEYLGLVRETFKNSDPFWTDARVDSTLKTLFPTRQDGSFYPATNWIDELYRSNSVTVANELSVSGGNDRQNFYLNLEYTKQNGVEKTTGFDRKSVRFNYENRPASWIKFGLNTALSYTAQEYGTGISEYTSARISPLNSNRDMSGNYIYNYSWGAGYSYDLVSNGSLLPNPIAAQELNINRSVSYRGLSGLYADLKFLKHFTFTPTVGADFMLTEAKEKIHPKFSVDGGPTGIGQVTERDIRNVSLISNNILRYNRVFKGKHNLNLLLGQEAQILNNKYLFAAIQNIANNPFTDQLYAGTVFTARGLYTKQTLLSYFHQTNYSYKDRYLLSASIRADGSSLFGENKRFGSHWSTGAGWVVSEEPFMKKTSGWLNYLKIRGSLGAAGNSNAILNSTRYDLLSLSGFLTGTGVYPNTTAGNPDIQWEKTFTWDAGLEMRLWKERIIFTGDIYHRKTSKLIGVRAIPWATGFRNVRDNVGDLTNKGIELSLSATIIKTNNLQWNIGANWSRNKNKLLKFTAPLAIVSGVLANGEGENYNSFYLPTWAGVDPATGKPLWIDSTGKPNSNYAAAKPSFVGKPQPDGFGAITSNLSWKGLELSALFNYQYGVQQYFGVQSLPFGVNDGTDPFMNQTRAALDRWQKPGDIATNPRRLLFGNINGVYDRGTENSTRYLIDGDFIRLSTLMLAYSLPKKMIERYHLGSCRIFVQGNNLAIWTKYSGQQDVENADAFGFVTLTYPLQRSFAIGLNLSF